MTFDVQRDMNVLDFPNEIQEAILSHLDIASLIAAARTCRQWKAVTNKKLLKRWCLANVTPDLLREMTAGNSEEDSCRIDWQELCERWAGTVATHLLPPGHQLPTTEDAPAQFEVLLSATTLSTSCVTMAVSGDCVIVGDQSEQLVLYDRYGREVVRRSNLGQPAVGMALVDMGWRDRPSDIAPSVSDRPNPAHDLVIVLTSEFVAIYSMQDADLRQVYYSSERPGSRLVSVDGCRFSLVDRTGKCVTVCRISSTSPPEVDDVTGDRISMSGRVPEVVVQVLHRFNSDNHVHNWKLWRDSLICILQNGGVVTRNLVTDSTIRSVTVSDFLYPFESFMHRGLIFCNISTARTLLNYWHVNMGLPHWLVSADNGKHFKRVRTDFSFKDEITTLCIHGTTMVAGTRGGRLCFYSRKGDDSHLPGMGFERPSLICKVSDGPIYRCDFGTAGDNYLVCAKTVRNTVLLVTLPLAQNFETHDD